MTPAQADAAINKRMIEEWPSKEPEVPFAFGDTVIAQPAAYFVRLYTVDLDSEQHTIGRRKKFERQALLEVRLFGPVGEGTRRLKELAQVVIDIFETKRFGKRANDFGIVTHASSLAPLRRDAEADHLAILTVTTPFEFYARHS